MASLSHSVGPWIIGGAVDFALLGTLTAWGLRYYRKQHEPSFARKTFVAIILLLSILKSIATLVAIWDGSVTHSSLVISEGVPYFPQRRIFHLDWVEYFEPFLTGIIALIARAFFSHCIWRIAASSTTSLFSRRPSLYADLRFAWTLLILIVLLSAIGLAGSACATYAMGTDRVGQSDTKLYSFTVFFLLGGACADLAISAFMLYHHMTLATSSNVSWPLRAGRSLWRSAVPSTIFSIANVILFVSVSTSAFPVFVAVDLPLSKLYALALVTIVTYPRGNYAVDDGMDRRARLEKKYSSMNFISTSTTRLAPDEGAFPGDKLKAWSFKKLKNSSDPHMPMQVLHTPLRSSSHYVTRRGSLRSRGGQSGNSISEYLRHQSQHELHVSLPVAAINSHASDQAIEHSQRRLSAYRKSVPIERQQSSQSSAMSFAFASPVAISPASINTGPSTADSEPVVDEYPDFGYALHRAASETERASRRSPTAAFEDNFQAHALGSKMPAQNREFSSVSSVYPDDQLETHTTVSLPSLPPRPLLRRPVSGVVPSDGYLRDGVPNYA